MRVRTPFLRTVPAGNIPAEATWKPTPPLAQRLWVYQRERFPLVGHGLLIGAFSSSAVAFSSLLRGAEPSSGWAAFSVAFLTSFFFFLQLRVADEFKDFEEDARWRPYRPVPRGVVSLGELGRVAVVGGLIQAGLAGWLSWRLSFLLLLVWGYLALMTKEFFVRDWIVRRPFTYLWTHMLIIPIADFYATACDWSRISAAPPPGLFWFLAVSFGNGVALEIGRKVRAPEDEEEGVRTYSLIWGRRPAVLAWCLALFGTAFSAGAAAARIGFFGPVAFLLGGMLLLAIVLAWQFIAHPVTPHAHRIELFSGVWTLVLYLSLGIVPLVVRLAKAQL